MIRAIALLLLGALSACTILPEREPQAHYPLPPSSLNEASAEPLIDSGLRIARPAASEALAGSRLLVRDSDSGYRGYPGVRWSAPAPRLWRDWLVDAYWRDGRIRPVSLASEGLRASMELTGMLRALHAERDGNDLTAVIRYDVLLVTTNDRRVIASRRFQAREPIASDTAPAIITALGDAADRLAPQLIDWTLQQTGP